MNVKLYTLQFVAYLETDGQRIVLDEQFNVVAGSQQLHDGFLVGGWSNVVSVHLEYPVTHTQFTGAGRNAAGYDLYAGVCVGGEIR